MDLLVYVVINHAREGYSNMPKPNGTTAQSERNANGNASGDPDETTGTWKEAAYVDGVARNAAIADAARSKNDGATNVATSRARSRRNARNDAKNTATTVE